MLQLILLVLIGISLWGWWLKIVKKGVGPMLRGSLPIIGYTHKLIGDKEKLHRFTAEISNGTTANGGVARIIITLKNYYVSPEVVPLAPSRDLMMEFEGNREQPSNAIVITDPEDFATASNHLVKKHFVFDFAKPWLGDGLVTSSSNLWKHHRKLLSPAFSLNLLHGFIQEINDQARELVESLTKEVGRGPVEITHYFSLNAMSVMNRTLLGVSKQENSDLLPKYLKAADEMMELVVTRFQNFWLHSDMVYKLTGLKKKEQDLIRVLNELSDVVIKAKRLQLNDVSDDSNISAPYEQDNNTFLTRLLKLSASGALTEKEVREEVDTILVAGVDTLSWAMTYICIALGTYSEIQNKVIKELTEIFGYSNRDVTKEDLQKLIYTEAVIKETLRLYPIAPASIRTVETELKLKNYCLRPGDHVIMSFYGVNRHPVWGPDANQFRPERWLEENTLPSVYAGFSFGKRGCIGKTYAIISMKVSLSHLLRRYIITGDITKLRLKMEYIAKPAAGHLVSISERCRTEADT